MRQLETPPVVNRVIDGDDYHVEVALDPRDVLPALLEALGSNAALLVQATRYRRAYTDEARRDALRRLAASPAVIAACRLRLAGGTAEDLGIALEELSTAPDRCGRDGCDLFEAYPHVGLCPGHLVAAERIPQAS